MIVHAGLVALRLGGRWRGALIEGPSGAGKSDLALRALEAGFRLVADDRVILWTSGGRLYGRAPDTLSGLIEAWGVGVVRQPPLALAQVALVVRPGTGERVPAFVETALLGCGVPTMQLQYLEDSAPAKLSRALQHFDGG